MDGGYEGRRGCLCGSAGATMGNIRRTSSDGGVTGCLASIVRSRIQRTAGAAGRQDRDAQQPRRRVLRVYNARTGLVPAGIDQVCRSDGLLKKTHLESRAAKGEA